MTYGDPTSGAATKADGAYLEMRNQILSGLLEPGSRVDYVHLSASLGVSITPLREALRRLEADHLVIRNAHRDVVIAPLTRAEAEELVAVRQELVRAHDADQEREPLLVGQLRLGRAGALVGVGPCHGRR